MLEGTEVTEGNTESAAKKKRSRKKKEAAKPAAAAAGAVQAAPSLPLDTAVAVDAGTTWDTADVPAVPELRRCLIAEVRGDTLTAKDKDTALFARELSVKHCHFCGKVSHASMGLTTPWGQVQLCACLDRYLGYREAIPQWQKRLPELLKQLRNGELSDDTLVYRDVCGCGKEIRVNMGLIRKSVHAHGDHRRMRACRTCKVMRDQQKQQDALRAFHSNGVTPTRQPAAHSESDYTGAHGDDEATA